jgi:hypothetical protein
MTFLESLLSWTFKGKPMTVSNLALNEVLDEAEPASQGEEGNGQLADVTPEQSLYGAGPPMPVQAADASSVARLLGPGNLADRPWPCCRARDRAAPPPPRRSAHRAAGSRVSR